MKISLKHWFSHLEVFTLSEWKNYVLSSSVPVIVHFHAEWSDKSNTFKKQLEPYWATNKWNIVEVQVDSMQSLVEALNIKTIPCVYLINKGKSLEKLEGKISLSSQEKIIDRIRILSGEWTEEDLAAKLLNLAYDFLEKKQYDMCIEKYNEALKLETCLEKYELTAWIGLSKAYFYKDDYENSEFFTDKIYKKYSTTISKYPDVKNTLEDILKVIGNKRENNVYKEYHHTIMSINNEISESPFNNEVHAKLAMAHYDFGFIKEALDKAVQIIRAEGTLTGHGYGALMEILKDLGPDSQYVKDFQPTLDKLHIKYRDKNIFKK